jgi:hypothetical protein
MRIIYDTSIKLAGIGMVPWGRLGPERWLPAYAIASLYGWDMPAGYGPRVVALADHVAQLPQLPRINTPSLLKEPEFQAMLDRELSGYDLLVYKPAEIPAALAGRKFLTTAPSYTETIENKAVFREMFGNDIRFPAYIIASRDDLKPDQESFDRLMAGRSRMIIQDEQLSGGKGSFIIDSFESYCTVIAALDQLSQHQRVVISDVVESPREVSVQCCVTQYGVFVGPLQQQVVNHPELAGSAVGGDKFCGVQIAASDQDTPLYKDVEAIARKVGERLQKDGYKGIYGADFLVSASGELYILEVNARITGATPLITALVDQDAGIPFYLLHLLELGDYPYNIEGTPAPFVRQGSLLVLHTLETTLQGIEHMPQSGTYRLQQGQLLRVSDSVSLEDIVDDAFIIQEYMPPGMKIKPGGRMALVLFAEPVLDAHGELQQRALEVVRVVRRETKLMSIEIID